MPRQWVNQCVVGGGLRATHHGGSSRRAGACEQTLTMDTWRGQHSSRPAIAGSLPKTPILRLLRRAEPLTFARQLDCDLPEIPKAYVLRLFLSRKTRAGSLSPSFKVQEVRRRVERTLGSPLAALQAAV